PQEHTLLYRNLPCDFAEQNTVPVNMNAFVGLNALAWVAVALAVLINEAAALGGGVGGNRGFGRKK
ncbi:hypothetical protein MTO96_045466, partial [Rhipicephalus appendiculatus]